MFLEYQWKEEDYRVIGLDEVGRGPLAGPVAAGGALFKGKHSELHEVLKQLEDLRVTDSKKLTSPKRRKIIESLGVKLDSISPNKKIIPSLFLGQVEIYLYECANEVIDEINILQASLLSMKTCALKLSGRKKTWAFFDGNKVPKDMPRNIKSEAVVKGDSKSALIGLASIFAKEYRDYLMEKLALVYPGYGFEKHAGYPTKKHLEAIRELGVTPIHRKTFKGVKEYL